MEVAQKVEFIHICLIPDRYELREAKITVRGEIEHRGAKRATLRDE